MKNKKFAGIISTNILILILLIVGTWYIYQVFIFIFQANGSMFFYEALDPGLSFLGNFVFVTIIIFCASIIIKSTYNIIKEEKKHSF